MGCCQLPSFSFCFVSIISSSCFSSVNALFFTTIVFVMISINFPTLFSSYFCLFVSSSHIYLFILFLLFHPSPLLTFFFFSFSPSESFPPLSSPSLNLSLLSTSLLSFLFPLLLLLSPLHLLPKHHSPTPTQTQSGHAAKTTGGRRGQTWAAHHGRKETLSFHRLALVQVGDSGEVIVYAK